MKKVAVLFAQGFEEAEAIIIVDIIRRAGIVCDMVGLEENVVGCYKTSICMDKLLNEDLVDYDMIVLPGGLPGAYYLRDCELLISYIQEMERQGKWIAGICAGVLALEKAGVLEGKNFTAFPGLKNTIKKGNFLDELVVKDKNIITSQGPATTFLFSYILMEALGRDTEILKENMLYKKVFGAER